MKHVGLKSFVLLTLILSLSTTKAAAQSNSEVSGTWRGTFRLKEDTCGFNERTQRFRHRVNAGKYGVTLYDQYGLGLVSSAVKNRSFYAVNYYIRGGTRIDVGYKYTNIRNERATVDFVTFFTEGNTQCHVYYSGIAEK